MEKKLIDRLIIVADDLRGIEADLMRINAKFPYEPAVVYKLGVELDILDSIIDGLQREIKQ